MMDAPPTVEIWGQKWRRGVANFATVAGLFEKRNLWALAAIAGAAGRQERSLIDAIRFTLTAMMLNASKMYRYRESGKGGFLNGNYYVPPLSQNMNARNQFLDKETDILKGFAGLLEMQPDAGALTIITEGSAMDSASYQGRVDYVFTDPPYLNVETQYAEMNFVWNAWLDLPANDLKSEISLCPLRGSDWSVAEEKFRKACFAIAESLKPGRFASFCYHDTSERNWQMVQDALLDAGLIIETVCTLDPIQKSLKQHTKEKIVKSDLVINCRKPRPGEQRKNAQSDDTELVSRRVAMSRTRRRQVQLLSDSFVCVRWGSPCSFQLTSLYAFHQWLGSMQLRME
jgi:hypothetical protein